MQGRGIVPAIPALTPTDIEEASRSVANGITKWTSTAHPSLRVETATPYTAFTTAIRTVPTTAARPYLACRYKPWTS